MAGSNDGSAKHSVLVGDSPHTSRLRERIRMLAPLQKPVLLVGEPGTAKELVALALHRLRHKGKNLEILSCTDFVGDPQSAQAELFGYEKGAFTGAEIPFDGVFARAGEGTAFLDEIGALDLPIQTKLNRIVEYERFRRMRAKEDTEIKCRIVAATNKPKDENYGLKEELVERFPFRIELLPLRERRCDLIPLFLHYCDVFCQQYTAKKRPFNKFEFPVIHQLLLHDWKRNVRELRNRVEEYVITRSKVEKRYDCTTRGVMKVMHIHWPYMFWFEDVKYLNDVKYFPRKWKDFGLKFAPIQWVLQVKFTRKELLDFNRKALSNNRTDDPSRFKEDVFEYLVGAAKRCERRLRRDPKNREHIEQAEAEAEQYWKRQCDVQPSTDLGAEGTETNDLPRSSEISSDSPRFMIPLDETLEQLIPKYVHAVYTRSGNISAASRSLGIHRTTVSRHLENYKNLNLSARDVG